MVEFLPHASSSAGNLYEVRDGDARLLIECGLRFADVRQALGHRVTALDGCLISHYHGDHARSARDIAKAGVDVYASPETLTELGLMSHRAHSLVPLELKEIGPWRVLPFELRHDAEGTLGFLIAGPSGDRLLFSCDTQYVPYRFRDVAILALECNYSVPLLEAADTPPERKARVLRAHMGLERVLLTLEVNDLSRVREIHLLHLSDQHSDAEAFRDAVEAATGKPVHVAPRDLREKETAA